MNDEVATRIFDELRSLQHGVEALRRGQQALCADVADVKLSLARFDDTPGFSLGQIAFLELQIASQTSRIDRFEAHIDSVRRQVERLPA
jgi:hypothetical protein